MAELTPSSSYDFDRTHYTRQHSRSSSQVATLASLSLANNTSSNQLPSLPPSPTRSTGTQSPRFSISGLTGNGNQIYGNGLANNNGIESPVYLSRSTTPEPLSLSNSGLERSGRLSLDGNYVSGSGIRASSSNSNFNTRTNLSASTGASGSGSKSSNNGSPSSSSLFTSEPNSIPTTSQPILSNLETSPTNLAQLIQQKRRQASAPYFASAKSSSLFSPGAGFGISSITSASERVEYAGAWGAGGGGAGELGRRARSRQATRAGSLVMNDEGGMVMTPTTAEWRQLGGQLSELADIRARDEAKIDAGLPIDVTTVRSPVLHKSNHSSGANSISTNSSSSSISLSEVNRSIASMTSSDTIANAMDLSQTILLPPISPIRPPPRPLSIVSDSNIRTFTNEPLTPPPAVESKFRSTSFSYQTSQTGFSHTSSLSFDSKKNLPSTPTSSSSPFIPSHRILASSDSIRPNLSQGSLSRTTGTPTPLISGSGTPLYPNSNSNLSTPVQELSTPPLDLYSSPSIATNNFEILLPVELDWTHNFFGPVDPRRYSAFTGLRSIDNFLILGEAGKGAYGTVCTAREKGLDGLPFGPDLVIKYIIKQRILADCWKKHKILGPIPIEVHVLDHLRRVPYSPRILGKKKESISLGGGIGIRRDSAPCLINKEGVTTGHPNICGMLDFFEDGEFYYLVMPKAGTDLESPEAPRGQDLFEHVDANADGLPPSSIKRILSQIADAISFLHQHGIVHRDIKDENVVLDHLGNAQLIDFGSAAYVKEGKKFDTFSGTLDFAAPEVLRGARYGGKETDIWAIGVLGYVIIIGECPFWSPEEAMQGLYPGSRAEIALRSKCSISTPSSSIFSISSLSSPTSTTSKELDGIEGSGRIEDAVDLVMRCLEVNPEDRPTADQILEHKFILGNQGWNGIRGWEKEEVEDIVIVL